ncbi:MAG: ATP-binding cassette domain-containing protein [Geobacteraceae bacterium]|nr:ATP-binding cassette domain-containing protein [Geobacteraceae bacterium]
MKRQLQYLRDECRSSSAVAWMQTLYSRGNNLVLAMTGVIILIVGGSAVSSGTMTLGALLSFYVTVGLMRDHLNATFDVVPQIIEGAESLNTLYGLLRETDTTPYTGKKKIDFEGRIEIRNVSFAYGERQVLKNINLEIRPGEVVAVIGGNGAGKSTLTYLILGFYLPQQGTLHADGHPFTKLDMTYLRRQMGVVTQDPMMFDGTILQNITYGSPEVDFEQVVHAARLSTADDFIRDLPEGYETLVGDNGLLLSGGQRQRISIARALLRRPKLLILDEPSNHIDSPTVGRLMHNLKGMDPSPTILIISHDREVVRHATHTFLIQDGYLCSMGTGA